MRHWALLLVCGARIWRQATSDPVDLEHLGLQTAENSPPRRMKEARSEQVLMQLLSFVLLLMEGQVWDTAWHHEAFPNRFATYLHRCWILHRVSGLLFLCLL